MKLYANREISMILVYIAQQLNYIPLEEDLFVHRAHHIQVVIEQ